MTKEAPTSLTQAGTALISHGSLFGLQEINSYDQFSNETREGSSHNLYPLWLTICSNLVKTA
jgi:hypothetical protein